MKRKMDRFGTNSPCPNSPQETQVIGKSELIAYSENIRSLAETLKLFNTDNILNAVCHHNNVEASSQIPNLWKDQCRRDFCFRGFVHCFWHSEDREETSSKFVDNKCCVCRTDFLCNNSKWSVLPILCAFWWQNY